MGWIVCLGRDGEDKYLGSYRVQENAEADAARLRRDIAGRGGEDEWHVIVEPVTAGYLYPEFREALLNDMEQAVFVQKALSIGGFEGCMLCPTPPVRGQVGRRWTCPHCDRRWYLTVHRRWDVARIEGKWPLPKPAPWWRRLRHGN